MHTYLRAMMMAALAVGVIIGGLSHASAFDLTGTWLGSYKCDEFDGVKHKAGNKTSTILITQNGNILAMSLNGSFKYNGAAIADAKKPDLQGEAVFNQCGTDNVPVSGTQGEILRAKVKTKTGTPKASFKGLSIFEDPAVPVGTCKYSFKRTDTTDPNVAACP
jgi:hypothetical protein